MTKCTPVIKRKLTPEELEKLLQERPILTPEQALAEEKAFFSVNQFEKELKAELAKVTLDRSGPY